MRGLTSPRAIFARINIAPKFGSQIDGVEKVS